jgi:hypothetical protein
MTDTLSANCTHENVQSWRFVDGDPAYFWSCADCKLKFVPIDGLLTAEREVEKLRAELARLTTEPVAWQWLDTANFRKSIPEGSNAWEWNPLYAHSPAPLPALKETK